MPLFSMFAKRELPRSNHGCSAFKVYKADLEWFPRKPLLFPTSRGVLHLDCFLRWQEGFQGGTDSKVQTIQCSSSNTSKALKMSDEHPLSRPMLPLATTPEGKKIRRA
ncbi:uncharacterized protein [Triticum aestivum]|uniref:uncharacterized protein isoform X2 n=1 Tax=Triticum aestivum TaxID=4565 RepID=UPI001D0110C0|nr:uncharacterized protein LOC123078837 isoform X2 [Triticum aestivum]